MDVLVEATRDGRVSDAEQVCDAALVPER